MTPNRFFQDIKLANISACISWMQVAHAEFGMLNAAVAVCCILELLRLTALGNSRPLLLLLATAAAAAAAAAVYCWLLMAIDG